MRWQLVLAATLLAGPALAIGPFPTSTISNYPSGTGHVEQLAAGDVNGDGYGDLIAGDSAYSDAEQAEGAVLIFFGGPDGLPGLEAGVVAPAAADRIMQSDLEFQLLGNDVAVANVNGDAYDDIIVADPMYDAGAGPVGRVLIWLGSATGPASGGPGVAAAELVGTQVSAGFGYSVEAAGDVDSDGYGDFLVSSTSHTDTLTSQGAVFLYRGSASGITSGAAPDATFLGNAAGQHLSVGMSGAGDINGDGYDDIVMSSTATHSWIFHGSNSGIASASLAAADSAIVSGQGFFFGSGGDINDDGYGDLAFVAPHAPSGTTLAVFYGSAAGIPTKLVAAADQLISRDDLEFWSYESIDFGSGALEMADVDGDGIDDLVLSDPSFDYQNPYDPELDQGIVIALFGGAGGLDPGVPGRWSRVSGPFFPTSGSAQDFGLAMTAAGDFNGDGIHEVAASEANGYFQVHVFEHKEPVLIPTQGSPGLVLLALLLGAAGLLRAKENAPLVSQRGVLKGGVTVDR